MYIEPMSCVDIVLEFNMLGCCNYSEAIDNQLTLHGIQTVEEDEDEEGNEGE